MAEKIKTMGSHDSSFSDVAVATVAEMPLRIDPPMEIVHKEARARVNQPKDKLLPGDVAKQVNQNAVWAMHYFNAPLPEPVFSINAHYLKVKRMAENYQREHQDAFFEQYSQAMILSDLEKESPAGTTAQIRLSYRRYAKRIAHYAYHYECATWMLTCSLVNLLILSQVNGPGASRNVGTIAKVSKIMSMANQYVQYPKLKGQEDLITSLAKFAVGSTGKGAQFVSMPHFVTDIYGNRGQHSFNLSDMGAWLSNSDQSFKFDDSSDDHVNALLLINRINKVIGLYGSDLSDANAGHLGRISHTLDPKNKYSAVPSMPVLENGAALAINAGNGDDKVSSLLKLNQSGTSEYRSFTYAKDPHGIQVESDNIVSRAWDTFRFWSEYIATYFGEMRQPGNTLREIVTELLDLVPSYTPEKMVGKVNFGSFVSAVELRKHMVYKKDNAANTATIVKWAPIIDVASQTSWLSTNQIVENLERYPVDQDDAITILKAADAWPHITPNIFHDIAGDESGDAAPFVINTIGSASVIKDEDAQIEPAAGIAGRFASYLDLVSSTDYDSYSAKIDTLMIDPELAKKFLVAGNGLSLAERPNNVYVPRQPIIDNTDPYQCGFNVIIAHDSVTLNEFDEWFRDINNYMPDASDPDGYPTGYEKLKVDGISKPLQFTPLQGIVEIDGAEVALPRHVSNEAYLEKVRHAVVFVGDAIFSSPRNQAMSMIAGNFPEIIKANQEDGFIQQVNQAAAGIPDSWVGNASLSVVDNIPGAIAKSLAVAASPDDPAIAGESDVFSSGAQAMKYFLNGFSASESELAESKQYMFSPDYGFIKPITYDTPDIEAGYSLGFIGVDANNSLTVLATKGLKPYVSKGHLAGSKASSYLSRTQGLTHEAAAAQMLLWFIDKVHFRHIIWDGQSYYCAEKEVKLPPFSAMAKADFTEYNRGEVEFLGSEDVKWLYDDDLVSNCPLPESPSLGSVALDQAPLVNPPKVDFRKGRPDKPFRQGQAFNRPRRDPSTVSTPDRVDYQRTGELDRYRDSGDKRDKSRIKDTARGTRTDRGSEAKMSSGKTGTSDLADGSKVAETIATNQRDA